MSRSSVYWIIAIIIAAIGGYFFSLRVNPPLASAPSSLVEVRTNSPEYKLINPLLYIDTTRHAPEYNSVERAITNYINSAKSDGLADSISVYFRNLDNGHWTGVSENDKYEPSSMLKVLVMMSYLGQAQENPAILNKKLYYQDTIDPGQYFQPRHPLSTGYHTVNELIESMITQSDNEAVHVLDEGNDKAFYNLYNLLGLPPVPEGDTISDYMSPHSYSALFRVLYNSTYLTNDVSEKALELLTKTDFKDGLVSGVPATTTVAHKFGEHTVVTNDGSVVSRELHDCGIIYTNSPYLLCVMTRGNDFSKLSSVIKDISKITYDTNPTRDNPLKQ